MAEDDVAVGELVPVLQEVLRRQGRSMRQAALVAVSLPGPGTQALIEDEAARIAALHRVTPLTGQRSDSKALEHLVEHLLYRRQEQLKFLRRVVE